MSAAAVSALQHLEQTATTTVSVSALHGGTITLPLSLFLADAAPTERSLVPSLAFLIAGTVLFDLGLRRDTTAYPPPIRTHLTTRQPLTTLPDVRQSLVDGGVEEPQRTIASVILSHVHWDHTGTPSDYPQAEFWVGGGALGVLAHGLEGDLGHQHFEPGLFSGLSVREFDDGGWQELGGGLLRVRDFLGDGALYVVDAPGHLPGHVNVLARVGEKRWVYLAGDACHDARLLTGQSEIAEWQDPTTGRTCCIHTDKKQAEATLARIRDLQAAAGVVGVQLEVILAHNMEWADANPQAFLPGTI